MGEPAISLIPQCSHPDHPQTPEKTTAKYFSAEVNSLRSSGSALPLTDCIVSGKADATRKSPPSSRIEIERGCRDARTSTLADLDDQPRLVSQLIAQSALYSTSLIEFLPLIARVAGAAIEAINTNSIMLLW